MHKREEPALIHIQKIYSWLMIAFTGVLAVFVLSLALTIGMNLMALFDASPAEASEALVPSPTATPLLPATKGPSGTVPETRTPPVTSTPSPTPTPLAPTPTPPASTPVPPTATPSPTLVPTSAPTEVISTPPTVVVDPPAEPTAEMGMDIPSAVKIDDEFRWIDVDLSEQRLIAYVGKTPVKSYLVSTGLPQTPTPVGQYAIWIKLRYDDMAGADYYIEDVPYVMYFHEGYGLHGVTWHANFGHRMSHGCVNQPNDMAAWLFHFAEVGTMVNIHE
jgi:lipoprotein-anchoring transpeptidase ErfK/SrfK